jgi:hypothetical protein
MHASLTGLPSTETIRRVVSGEVEGTGDHALSSEDVQAFFKVRWNRAVDPLSLEPLRGMGYGAVVVGRKGVVGFDAGRSGAGRSRGGWGLRGRVEAVLGRRCERVRVGGKESVYLRWRDDQE